MWSRFKTLDVFLFLVPLILASISIIFIYTLTFDQVGYALAVRQGIAALLGIGIMLLLTFTDYRAIRAWRYWIYGFVLSSLISVFFIGTTVFGATSWIDLGIFQFQPGEAAKIAVIIILAGVLQARRKLVSVRSFTMAGLLLVVPVVLVLAQPDFGTALVITALGLSILLHAKLRLSQRIITLLVIGLAVTSIFLSFRNVGPFGSLLKDYQKNRLASFVDPALDPGGSGYNVLQSKIAVGAGGITGRGLGFGSQSQLNFLPVVYSDFIFAAIAEAWGLVGSYGMLLLFGVLIIRLIQAARLAQDEFGSLVCVGVATMLLFQVLVNVGMNIGMMPVTGIPLPFLSYGGTAMLTYCAGIGIAQSVVIRSKRLTF